MSDRYPGGFIKAVPDEPTEYTAPGIWTLEQAAVYKKAGKWPLTSDPYFNQTTLLLHGDGSGQELCFEDNSSNDFPITVNGDAYGTPFSPYNTSWSNYFDGSGDLLSIPSAVSTFQGLGANDFSYECFVYPLKQTNTYAQGLITYGQAGSTGTSTCDLVINASGYFQIAYATGAAPTLVSPALAPINTWTHIVVCRSGSTLSMFVNGTRVSTASTSATVGSSGDVVYIGNQWYAIEATRQLQGYISNARVLIGSSAYDATQTTITVPTSALTAITDTELLTCQSNRFVDNSTNNFAITVNGDPEVKSLSPFAETDTTTGSGYFDGNGDYLALSGDPVVSTNFTIEFWFYMPSWGDRVFLSQGGGAANFNTTNGVAFQIYSTSPTFYVQWSNGAGSFAEINTATSGIALNAWHHVAIGNNGTTTRVWVDGVSVGTNTGTPTWGYPTTRSTYIGYISYSSSYVGLGYMSDVRIVTSDVYGANNSTISVPTSPATSDANTELLTCQYRNAVRNVGFIDSSPNKFLITRNGNTTQGTFSPFSNADGEWSGYFSGGSTSYIETDATTLFDQNAAATFQCWIYPTQFLTSTSAVRRMYIFVKGVIYAGLSIHSDGTLGWYGYPAGSIITASPSGTIVTNEWQHIAIIVDPTSNYIKLYKNGVEVGTSAYSAYGTNGAALRIGIGDTGQSGTDAFIGYMSNVKVSASVASLDYASPPVPSTTSGAGLLTLQANRFYDASGNRTVTPYAAVSIQPFSPFAPSAAYSASVNGGSAYLDGTGDYLTFTKNTTSGAFTCECWFYRGPNVGGAHNVFAGSNITSVNADNIQFIVTNSGGIGLTMVGVVIGATGTAVTQNAWSHLVWVRDASNNVATFVNGNRISTATTSAALNVISVGCYYANYSPNGYITDARIVNEAVYDPTLTTLTVPTAPLTAVSNTYLLANFTNAGIFDNTAKNDLETVGNAQVDTSVVKYGQGSMKFDGTGDYLVRPYSQNIDLNKGDFTIEAWVYPTGTKAFSTIASMWGAAGFNSWIFNVNNGTLGFAWRTENPSSNFLEAGSVSLNTWSHVAAVRSGNTFTIYLNGVSQDSGTSSDNSETTQLTIGAYENGAAGNFQGFIDDLRITKGVARYTANFTPPGGPFLNK